MFNQVTDRIEKELTPPAFTVIYDKLKLNAFVHSAQLEVPPKAGRLQITIEPGTRAARGGNESKDTLSANVEHHRPARTRWRCLSCAIKTTPI